MHVHILTTCINYEQYPDNTSVIPQNLVENQSNYIPQWLLNHVGATNFDHFSLEKTVGFTLGYVRIMSNPQTL